MKVYISAPLFTEKQKFFNILVCDYFCDYFTSQNIEVDFLLPQQFKIENGNAMPNSLWANKVQRHDIDNLETADLVIGIVYGEQDPDNGTAFELGWAAAKKKPIFLVYPDIAGKKYSLMFQCMACREFEYNSKTYKFHKIDAVKKLYWT